MGASRGDILDKIRTRLGRNEENARAASGAMMGWLAARSQGPRPRLDGDLLDRFREKSEGLSSTVDMVAAWDDIPGAVARYLKQQALPLHVVGWPLISGHPWADAGISFAARGAVDADRVGVTGCYCAIAETGTLMLLSGPDTPATVSLLPETHIAIVAASRIVAGMEEAWALARAERGELPRAVNFISGPSRTGDIEQTIVLGAHGPYRVHLVVVTGA
jgi:L-lactate dehydrogenase complex protein LldG